MKALILAGGRGKRLNELSAGKNKCMLLVNGRPIIDYSLQCAARTTVSEIVIVVGYRAEEIINNYGNSYGDKPIKYVIQRKQKGLVHAIECSREMLSGEDFMLMLADELLINPRHKEMIACFERQEPFGLCGIVVVDDKSLVSKTYSVIESGDNQIFRLIEKSNRPTNNIMGTGNCILKNEILSYIDQTPINQKRGERELPDLIQCAIDDGNVIRSFKICDHYVNLNIPIEFNKAESYFTHF